MLNSETIYCYVDEGCFAFCHQLYQGRGQRFLKLRPNHILTVYFHLFMSCTTPHLLLLV